jgi:hypothetical protein
MRQGEAGAAKRRSSTEQDGQLPPKFRKNLHAGPYNKARRLGHDIELSGLPVTAHFHNDAFCVLLIPSSEGSTQCGQKTHDCKTNHRPTLSDLIVEALSPLNPLRDQPAALVFRHVVLLDRPCNRGLLIRSVNNADKLGWRAMVPWRSISMKPGDAPAVVAGLGARGDTAVPHHATMVMLDLVELSGGASTLLVSRAGIAIYRRGIKPSSMTECLLRQPFICQPNLGVPDLVGYLEVSLM